MSHDPATLVSQLLRHWSDGDDQALSKALPLVYNQLHRVARVHMLRERADHTLQPTALVNEVYLRLSGGRIPDIRNRPHFIAIASLLIRQILVDHARERRAGKRHGGCRLPFEFLESLPVAGDKELLALDDALKDLALVDERQARIVDMKYFGGLSHQEIAAVFELSSKTIEREWATARVWLRRQLSHSEAV